MRCILLGSKDCFLEYLLLRKVWRGGPCNCARLSGHLVPVLLFSTASKALSHKLKPWATPRRYSSVLNSGCLKLTSSSSFTNHHNFVEFFQLIMSFTPQSASKSSHLGHNPFPCSSSPKNCPTLFILPQYYLLNQFLLPLSHCF